VHPPRLAGVEPVWVPVTIYRAGVRAFWSDRDAGNPDGDDGDVVVDVEPAQPVASTEAVARLTIKNFHNVAGNLS